MLTSFLASTLLMSQSFAAPGPGHGGQGQGNQGNFGGPPSHGHNDHHQAPMPVPVAAVVTVDNHFDGNVQFRVDGAIVASVQGDSQLSIAISPGRHMLTVHRGAAVLARQDVILAPRGGFELDVAAPWSSLTLTNTGPVPLYFEHPSGRSAWVQPRGSLTVPALSGKVPVAVFAPDPRGSGQMVQIESRNVFVEPAVNNQASFAAPMPPPRPPPRYSHVPHQRPDYSWGYSGYAYNTMSAVAVW